MQVTECIHLDELVGQSRTEIAASHAHLASKDKEIHSLRQQLSVAVRERDQLKADKTALEAQRVHLKEDLATMTHENQFVNHELHKAVQHREQLGQKLQECTQNLLKCEEALAAKVQKLNTRLLHPCMHVRVCVCVDYGTSFACSCNSGARASSHSRFLPGSF